MPQFVLLQLYYLYCKFKNSNPNFGPPGSSNQVPEFVFRDQGRPPPVLNKDLSVEQTNTSGSFTDQKNSSDLSPAMNMEQSSRDQNTMGIIEEEDSLDFS